MELSDSISKIPGVGSKLLEQFEAKGLFTIEDLLFYTPRKYNDYSCVLSIAKLHPGLMTIKATLENVTFRRVRRGLSITEAIASDESGSIKVVWFNQAYRKASIKTGSIYFISGTFKLVNSQFKMMNPTLELEGTTESGGAGILPVYPESKSLSSWQIRRIVRSVIPLANKLIDPLPRCIVRELRLLDITQATQQIHCPSDEKLLKAAQRRFQFDELFPLLLANEFSTAERRNQRALKVNFKVDLARQFVAKLPFKLTDDQRRIIWQIYQDMQRELPMNRLVEGDVGSGKTVVAVMSAVMALAEGYKVAFMAPTELLAKQHYDTIKSLLKPLGLENDLLLLTGSLKKAEKESLVSAANSSRHSFIVGTHSLLTSGIQWQDLALIIIDEQHRFGVDQRSELQKQTGHLPHFLSITATPIPRSLMLTVFNDLDLSVLKQLPSGRKPITTKLIPPSSMKVFFKDLMGQLIQGRQIYIVCPRIHTQDINDYLAAEKILDIYTKQFKGFRVELLHGQMPSIEQTKIMEDFKKNKISILVSTTVIEVGVDVPNACVMAIYGPESFGLAQLHQLRGRVGRGEYESFCYLVLNDSAAPSTRIRQFTTIPDGFRLSELDLKLRGPGSIYGKLQHGKILTNQLILDNQELIDQVKTAVAIFIDRNENLVKYPVLEKRVTMARQLTYLN